MSKYTVKKLINELSKFPGDLPVEILIQTTINGEYINVYSRNFMGIDDAVPPGKPKYVEIRLAKKKEIHQENERTKLQ
jgi:hypothetical protein